MKITVLTRILKTVKCSELKHYSVLQTLPRYAVLSFFLHSELCIFYHRKLLGARSKFNNKFLTFIVLALNYHYSRHMLTY